MKPYSKLTKEELINELDQLTKEYEKYKSMDLHLDMTRGKPCKEQLDFSLPMMDILNSESDYNTLDSIDSRNYGSLDGITECRRLFSSILDVKEENIIVGGNSSLSLMFDCVSKSFTHGVMGEKPWYKLDKVKWLCPVPGYDRHFRITEYFNIEMINIPLNSDGPDMDMVEKLVENDDSIKGIWCVPMYSNPDGIVYSDEVVKRFSMLKPKAKDFRIYWDNAYCVHHFNKEHKILNIIEECEKAGNTDLVYEFSSTSKITYSGGGISCIATSQNNKKDILNSMMVQTIGYDKVNELRHSRFLKDRNGVNELMKKHASILKPKFDLVLRILDEDLEDLGIARYTRPDGGYFISLYTMNGLAKKVVERCKNAGVKLTEAGATYPYHLDPNDNNIRIAPSYPPFDIIDEATKILALSIKIESINKLLEA